MKMRTSNARDERSPLIAHGGVDGGGDRPTTFAAIGRRTKMMLVATAVVLCGGAALASSADARAHRGLDSEEWRAVSAGADEHGADGDV